MLSPRPVAGTLVGMRRLAVLLLAATPLACSRGIGNAEGTGLQPDPVAAKIAELGASKPSERQQAALSLGNMGRQAEPAIPALTEALQDRDQGVRRQAAWALTRAGSRDKALVPFLVEMLKDKSPEVRGTALQGLGSIGPDGAPAVPALVEVLRQGTLLDRKLAAEALGQMGPAAKGAIPVLQEALKTDPVVRRAAGEALNRIERDAARPGRS